MTPSPEAEALAECWAAMDGKGVDFKHCRKYPKDRLSIRLGTYIGYITEAEHVIEALARRGFEIRRKG